MIDREAGAPGTDWERRLREIFAEPGLAGLAAATVDLQDCLPRAPFPRPAEPTGPGESLPAGNAIR